MHKMERVSSSFFEQSKKVFKKTRAFVVWVPVLSLMIGFALSAYVHRFLDEKNLESEKAEAFRKAKEITNQLDLMLANSILRVQSYEETFGVAPLKYEKQEVFYIRQAMPYTIFKRISVFKEIESRPSSKKPVQVRQIFRVTLPNSNLPDVPFDYLHAADLVQTFQAMKAKGSFIKSVLYEKNSQARLSVIIRSKSQNNIYFIFTTPFTSLFANVDLEPMESLTLTDSEQGIRWLIKNHKASKEPEIELKSTSQSEAMEPTSKEKFHVDIIDGMEQSGLTLDLKFTFTKQTAQFLSAGNIAFGGGIFITIIISFLFYVLISQNRSANKLLIDKSLALEKTAHDLQEALEEKTKFLGKVSHEIRTPLNLILGMIDLCEENDTEKKLSTYLRSMKSSGDHLLSMIDDLIDLAKVESRDLHFQGKKLNLNQFLGDVLKLIGQECQKKNLKLYSLLSANLPNVVVTDPNRLRQVFLNLLRNAVKYTQEGHIIFSATATTPVVNNKIKLKFAVQDTGVGIPSDKINKIFDAFFQVDGAAASAEGGVGLGLSIVSDIVKRMDGQVVVRSAPLSGSIFEVDLEMEAPESESWLQYFKTFEGAKTNLVLVSNDELFRSTFAPLKDHPNFNLKILNGAEFRSFMGSEASIENYYIVLDGSLPKDELQTINFKFNYKKIIVFGSAKDLGIDTELILASLTNFPALISSLLNAIGLSNRSRERKDLKPASHFNKADTERSSLEKQSISLLIADDDLGNIELYKAYFSSLNWDIRYSYNGLEAWENYLQRRPQVLVLDLRMPVMDGFQTIDKIRDYEKTQGLPIVPIILVTADLLEYTATTVKKYQSVELLTKPVRKSQLISAIEKIVTHPKELEVR